MNFVHHKPLVFIMQDFHRLCISDVYFFILGVTSYLPHMVNSYTCVTNKFIITFRSSVLNFK